MSDRVPCAHTAFAVEAHANRLAPNDDALDRDEISGYRLSLRVTCSDCDQEFGFRSPDVGALADRPSISLDALELRAPLIAPSELELLGPAAARRGDGIPGFTMRETP